jgi:release factor glutamine methyltransferase
MSDERALAALVTEIEGFWQPRPDRPEETPEGIARALWSTAAGRPASATAALSSDLPDLDPAAAARLRDLVERARGGAPLAHLTERQAFMGLELFAGPEALIPRRETELLGESALAKLRSLADERGPVLALDICTGSGNLALAFAVLEPRARVFGSDLSAAAVDLARRNQAALGVPGERLELRAGDLLAPFESDAFLGQCDLICCNPPYISTAKVPDMRTDISAFEPAMAFDGGPYGVSILMKVARQAHRFLKPRSWLCFEVGLGQGPAMVKQLRALSYHPDVEVAADASGIARCVMARTA